MVISAYLMVVQLKQVPKYKADTVLIRGDNRSAVYWVNKAGGARDPRGGALMRLLGALEWHSDWSFNAVHISGVKNILADTVSRGSYYDVASRLTMRKPGVNWQEVRLNRQCLDIIIEVLDKSWQEQHWDRDLWTLIPQIGGSGVTSVNGVIDHAI
jgi:hypothetical protein